MAQCPDLFPPIDAGVEFLNIGWDFWWLSATTTITSVQLITCTIHPSGKGTDQTPSTRLVGSSSIITSPKSGLAAQAVEQQVGGMVAGVTYVLLCVVNTSDGQKPSEWARLSCQPVT